MTSWSWDADIVRRRIARLAIERDQHDVTAKRRREIQRIIDRWVVRFHKIQEEKDREQVRMSEAYHESMGGDE